MEMKWYKLTKRGLGSKAFLIPGTDGVYVSTIRCPYTDGQTTLEYVADHGIVHLPVLCHHGHARSVAYDHAKSLL